MVSRENLGLIFNFLILLSSISLFLFIIIVWCIWDSSVLIAFFSSLIFSFICFHSLKLALLKNVPKTEMEEESLEEHTRKSALLVFIAILLIIMVPIVVLFLIPRLGLLVMDGIIGGASMSNLVLHVKTRKKSFK